MSSRLGDPENMGLAVGTARLFVIEAEIQVLPVWRPPSWVSGVGQRRMLSDMCSLFIDPENMGFAVGMARLSVVEAELPVLPVWRPPFCILASHVP